MANFSKTRLEELYFIQKKDPAPCTKLGIIFFYPGYQAVLAHRLSHCLYKCKIPILPRWIAYISRFITGIEIHPGAKIGKNFFIDHGMGVVIGETTVIKDNVHIYHGVTLGATSSQKKSKRHPNIEDNVTIGAHSLILGDITIGKNSKIAAGAVVVEDIPEDSVVIGVKSRVMIRKQKQSAEIEYYI